MMLGLLGLLMGCQGCRVEPLEDTGPATVFEDYNLGEVWLGGEVARRLPIDADELSGDDALSLVSRDGYVDVRWVPTALGETTLDLDADGQRITLTATVIEPGLWPQPLATTISLEPLNSLAENQLGDAYFPESGPIPIAADPINGEAWFGSADQGRAWRLDVFYNHSAWGLWVCKDIEQRASWDNIPSCFLDTSGLLQDGTCTGAERNTDGSIPRNWRYLHGGFVGESGGAPQEDLSGLSAMVSDELSERIWLLGDDNGAGWMKAIDLGLAPGIGEGEDDAYTFRQLAPDLNVELGDGWSSLRSGLLGDELWIASIDSGQIASLSFTGTITTLTTVSGLQEVVQVGDVLILLSDTEISGVSLSGGEQLFSEPRPAGSTGAPLSTWSDSKAAWLVFSDQMLIVPPSGEHAVVLPPEGVSLVGVVTDTIAPASPLQMSLQYVAGVSASGGLLWGASPEGVWFGEPLQLPATPRAIGHARDPHDIFLLYAAGSEGCDHPELEALCQDGERPPVVHSLYNPYSLVPPTANGHPLNLFLSPILETPKDNGVGSDFSQGFCSFSKSYGEEACCALDWVTEQRLKPNISYFVDTIQSIGEDTPSIDNDPSIVWGVNPTVLHQAIECMESDNDLDREAGLSMYRTILELPGARSSIANWTHTAAGEEQLSKAQDWFIDHAPDSTDYTAPVSNQYEYRLLQDGMSSVFDPTRLPEVADELLTLDPATLWTPLMSGNALDAYGISTFMDWKDPDWLTPIRDSPLSINQPPRSAYYFLSAGVELEIEMTKFRKKELYPYDIRERTVSWLSTDINAPGVPDPESRVINLPGMSWEIGTISAVSDAGAFRETLRFAVQVEERDWTYAHRYVRRLIASSQPNDVKSWYIHIFDITSPNGLFTENSGVTDQQDVTLDAILRFNRDFVAPGYARWALPEEILVEWSNAQ